MQPCHLRKTDENSKQYYCQVTFGCCNGIRLLRHQAATSPFSLVRDINQICAPTMQVENRDIPREANQIAKLAGNGQHELLVYDSAPLAVLHLLGSPRSDSDSSRQLMFS